VQDDKNLESLPGTPANQKRVKNSSNQTALAMELPFTFAGAILLAGGAGFLLDRWLHTKPVFTLIFGAIGFIAGVREVIRRLPGK
jgi:F0F1-type ATP synthase assembly protein I